VLTPQKGQQPNLEYTPFARERVILICGSETDTAALNQLAATGKKTDIQQWLRAQVWFTSNNMGYLKNFWAANFDGQPDFKPNYVVPNLGSVLRCLRGSKGFAVMPDFLCKKEMGNNTIRLAWEGSTCVENTLHLGKRKKTLYARELRELEQILTQNWFA